MQSKVVQPRLDRLEVGKLVHKDQIVSILVSWPYGLCCATQLCPCSAEAAMGGT